ncbi:phage shock protein PspC (stress-responsive transcriptional regulator) [Actinoalloteichus hoggarensis]|uniref:PspC domain protein n=1 Tax=Actinoalloteichus hoggarensis TaxID=1470176 RepID=A0A221W9R0_9PSEU|nr:PspC domain-containing protein [Actinoalloteichus hoggarensis]ASO22732.1 PspC domain protein [Actinoalloteichus hoggarensis]MBB5924126.1 phage shock protein PspC (stress-responsive transcriptional regulator) [Actinoalloteichus hoggarensis]
MDAAGQDGPSGATSTARPRFEDTIKDLWRTRPVRSSEGRKIAGVAVGVARRYDLDPTLIRVVLVVTSFWGGCGVLLYLLGWLLLRQEGELSSPAEALAGRGRDESAGQLSTVVLPALLGIAMVPVVQWVLNGAFTSAVCLGGSGVALYLLHANRGHSTPRTVNWPETQRPGFETTEEPRPGTGRTNVEATTTAFGCATGPAPAPGPDAASDAAYFASNPDGLSEPPTPPAWDPLGVAPFAWDLPDPVGQRPAEPPESHPGRRTRSRVTPVTAALALLTFAASLPLVHPGSGLTPPRMLALVLAVLGAGMVIGALRGGGRGLIWLTTPVAALTFLLGLLPLHETGGWHGAGAYELRVTDPNQLQDSYRLSAGVILLDLTELEIPAGETLRSSVIMNLGGDIEVIVPPDLPIRVNCETRIGGSSCLDHDHYYEGSTSVTSIPEESDSGVLELDMYMGAGQLEVRYG